MAKAARIAVLSLALCALTAAPAHAAFFPDLTIALGPATASGNPALTAVISQPATDTPIERFSLALPSGFSIAAAPGASVCATGVLAASACPAASQIGWFDGRLGARVTFAGGIYRTGPSSFGFTVSVLGGAVRQVVQGTLEPRASGALDIKLDQLPALPISMLTLRLWGGQRSLIRAPDRCGTYTIDGKFTSRRGELAIDRTLMPITGCAGVPAVQVANVRLSATRFRAGGSLYGTRTVIAWWASRAVDHTDLRVERRVHGAWRVVGVLVATGNTGDNAVRWDGRVRNRALKPGSYCLRIQPAGSAPAKLVRFRIVR